MANKRTVYPTQTYPVKQRVQSVVTEGGRKVATLACGHQIGGRTAWAGKLRWCPTCSRSSETVH